MKQHVYHEPGYSLVFIKYSYDIVAFRLWLDYDDKLLHSLEVPWSSEDSQFPPSKAWTLQCFSFASESRLDGELHSASSSPSLLTIGVPSLALSASSPPAVHQSTSSANYLYSYASPPSSYLDPACLSVPFVDLLFSLFITWVLVLWTIRSSLKYVFSLRVTCAVPMGQPFSSCSLLKTSDQYHPCFVHHKQSYYFWFVLGQ